MRTERLLVIQEHNAISAGLHWDVRFEHYKGDTKLYDDMRPNTNEPTKSKFTRVLRSLVIPKHRFPELGERLLVIGVEDHPWEYRNFEGEIKEGYGKGTVKLLHNDYTIVEDYSKNKIVFTHEGERYKIYAAPWMKAKDRYLITRL